MKRNNMKITSKKIIIRKIFENDSKKKKKFVFFLMKNTIFFLQESFQKLQGKKDVLKIEKRHESKHFIK